MNLLDGMKEVADLVKKLGDIELYRKIVELEGQLIDLTREKRDLETRVQSLQSALEFAGTLEFKSPLYYAAGDPTPYCATCWENNHKAIHVQGGRPDDDGDVLYTCRVCENSLYAKPLR